MGPSRRPVGRRRLRAGPPAPQGLLHRHLGVHRLQGLRGRVQGVEPGPRRRLRALRDVLRQHPRARRQHVAARRVRRKAPDDDRPGTSGNGSAGRDGPGDRLRRRGRALADVVRRVQALHSRGLPRRLPDRLAVPHRVRHRGRATGHLQRLRLLRARLPVRRHRPAQGGRARVQVHTLLRPAQGGPDARVRAGLPDRVDPVRRPRRAARARGPSARGAAREGRRRGTPLRPRPRRRGRRRRRVLPAARRARGLRPAAGPGRHHSRPRVDLEARRCGGGHVWPRSARRPSWGADR